MAWLPNPDDPRKFMLDISQHQGIIDFTKMIVFDSPPVEAVICRTGISWGYADKWFPRNWQGLKAYGCKRDWYHVLYPAQSVERQVDNVCRILGEDLGEGAGWWDVELYHDVSQAQLTSAAERAVDLTERKLGRRPGIYSRPFFVRDYMIVSANFYSTVLWWLALYTRLGSEHNGTGLIAMATEIGIPAANIVGHQTSDKGRGSAFGTQSNSLDFDRWMGNEAQWKGLWRLDIPEPDLRPFEQRPEPERWGIVGDDLRHRGVIVG